MIKLKTEHCCDEMGSGYQMKKTHNGVWRVLHNEEYEMAIKCCPFCGDKLNE